MAHIQPVLHRILVKVQEVGLKTDGGIYLPETDEAKRRQKGKEVGEVVAVGPTAFISSSGETLDKIEIGDTVYFVRYAGTELENPQDKKGSYRLINDEDIIAILKDGE